MKLPDKYRNRVFNEDVLKVLSGMPDNCVDMIYGDPDYGVGINYNGTRYTQNWMNIWIGMSNWQLNVCAC